MFDLVKFNMLLDANNNCSHRSCKECRNICQVKTCPLGAFSDISLQAQKLIEKYLDSNKTSVVSEEMFLNIFTEGT